MINAIRVTLLTTSLIATTVPASEPYHILITNDDGIFAKGLTALVAQLSDDAQITVSAPRDKVGGSSHFSQMWAGPMQIESVDIKGSHLSYAVAGTPADAARFGIIQAAKAGNPVDLVISGINSGETQGRLRIYPAR